MNREEAARRFAELIGGHFDPESRWIDGPHPTIRGADTSLCRLPAPDAPLHEHLAFVGRVAEAIGDRWELWNVYRDGHRRDSRWHVGFTRGPAGASRSINGLSAADPSHAALLAAIAAKEPPHERR